MREKGREKRFQYVGFTVLLQRGHTGGGEGEGSPLLMQKPFLVSLLQEGQEGGTALLSHIPSCTTPASGIQPRSIPAVSKPTFHPKAAPPGYR